MRLLRLAIESERWDLAAHTLVLATVIKLHKGDKPHASRSKEKKSKGQ